MDKECRQRVFTGREWIDRKCVENADHWSQIPKIHWQTIDKSASFKIDIDVQKQVTIGGSSVQHVFSVIHTIKDNNGVK